MTKLQFNGNQYTLTIPIEVIARMHWMKGTDVYVGKDPNKDMLYVEEIPKKKGG